MKKSVVLEVLLLIAVCSLLSSLYKKLNHPSSGTHAGHDYIDMGLSVKWATCNIGASSPEDYGDYFAWGETATKQSYEEVK